MPLWMREIKTELYLLYLRLRYGIIVPKITYDIDLLANIV
jgi:hypothetical protein